MYSRHNAMFTSIVLLLASPLIALTTARPYDQFEAFQKRADVNACATVQLAVNVPLYSCVNALGGNKVTVTIDKAPAGDTCTATTTTEPVNVGEALCLCLDAGVLTPTSVARISGLLTDSTTAGLVTELTVTGANGNVPFTTTTLLTALEASATAQLNAGANVCTYPDNAIATACASSGTCPFVCNSGYVECSGACVLGTTCPSGTIAGARRRSLMQPESLCFAGLTACALPSSSALSRAFECLDTTSNIESCGACAFPLPYQPKGQDCTTIPNTQSVACIASTCVITSCEEGFTKSADGKACVEVQGQTKKSKRGMDAYLRSKQVRTDELRKRSKVAGSSRKARAVVGK